MFTKYDISDNDLLMNLPPAAASSATTDTDTSVKKLHPETKDGMSKADFETWTVPELSQYLADRCINKSGNKAKLVENVYGAYKQKLPITFTDPQQEKEQIKIDTKKKLVLENGMITLPNPSILKYNWYEAPAYLPDTIFSDVEKYLKDNDAGKAFQVGKSLLESGHLHSVAVHLLSPTVRYCFVQGYCHPEQRTSNPEYTVWVILNKDTGVVINGHCGCVAGYVIFVLTLKI